MAPNKTPEATPVRPMDCGQEIKHQANSISAAVDLLKSVGVKFGFEKKKIDALNSEGTVLTEILSFLCHLYQATTEDKYPVEQYREDILAIGMWQVEVSKFGQEVHASGAGQDKPDEKTKEKKEDGLDELIDSGKDLIKKSAEKLKHHDPKASANLSEKAAALEF